MSLNIKNERVHALAREAAERTGHTQTSVIEEALRQLLDRLDDDQRIRVEKVEAILADVDRRLTDTDRALLTTDDLYDQRGIPA
jgi:antitoxin VapB